MRRELLKQVLHHPGRVGTQHQHFPVRHIDHAQQAVGNRQAQGGKQQYRTQRQAAKRLAQQIAPHQAAFNPLQAFFCRLAYGFIGLHCGLGQPLQAGLGVRIAGLAQQFHRPQPNHGLRAGQLQAGRRHRQRGMHARILFEAQALRNQREKIGGGVIL